MSEQKKHFSNSQTLLFVIGSCFIAALILSLLASGLRPLQEQAITLFRSKQLLIASRILSHKGHFLTQDREGHYVAANYDATNNRLAETKTPKRATDSEILSVYKTKILPRLTDNTGKVYSFDQLNIDQESYMSDHQDEGYARLKYKLLYFVIDPEKKNPEKLPAQAYVIPVNGYGLWDAMYGYICLAQDANTVVGTTWYEQSETPGLGGEIADPQWQAQFQGKRIFQKSTDEPLQRRKAPIGITVVKGTVRDVFGDAPKAKSAVDGISGATITGTGVTEAYKKSLSPYRAFLIKAHEAAQ